MTTTGWWRLHKVKHISQNIEAFRLRVGSLACVVSWHNGLSTRDFWTQPQGHYSENQCCKIGIFQIVPRGCIQKSPVRTFQQGWIYVDWVNWEQARQLHNIQKSTPRLENNRHPEIRYNHWIVGSYGTLNRNLLSQDFIDHYQRAQSGTLWTSNTKFALKLKLPHHQEIFNY